MNIKQKSNKFRSIVNEMADLYEKKNSNYGDSFGQLFKELGPTAGLVPLWNKLHRATSLIKGNKNNFESLEDTFKDLACYAIMNLIEMEAQKGEEIDSVEELKKYITAPNTILEGNRDIGFGDPIPTSINPCEGCETQKMLSRGINYIGDLPCQWCSKNPLRFQCISGNTASNDGTYRTHTLNNRKGETNNEK
jgi:hypothetical protein